MADERWRRALRRVEAFLVELTESPTKILAVTLLCGIGFAAVEYAAHTLLVRSHIPSFAHSLLDATIIGLSTAVIASLLLVALRARRRKMLHDVRRIAELNHRVRNALQVIVDTQYVSQSDRSVTTVLASVGEIDNTLHHLFPAIGERVEDRRLRLVNAQKRAALLAARKPPVSVDRRRSDCSSAD